MLVHCIVSDTYVQLSLMCPVNYYTVQCMYVTIGKLHNMILIYNVLVRTQIVETVHFLSWNLRPTGYNCWIMCNTCGQMLTPWFTLNQHLGWQSTNRCIWFGRHSADCYATVCLSSFNQDVDQVPIKVSIWGYW